jgi:acyl-CoA reductase-like NAD-dependent aldehyde dehydrogenase
MGARALVPLLIDGVEVSMSDAHSLPTFCPNSDNAKNEGILAIGANPDICIRVVESCSKAFNGWKKSHPTERQHLFHKLAQVCFLNSYSVPSRV